MAIKIHPHAAERMKERGTNEEEVSITIETGESFPAKFDRTGFRRNFSFNGTWNKKKYNTKQVEVIAVNEDGDWIIVTTLVKYF
ncbi:MAG: DUF4258 domain-containing protein [Candidatus Aminicenantes bacterium]|nr:DUF4258 domain-containing protein [Candidatus Aminicenantes bacterium]